MSERNPWVTITHPETGNEATVRQAAVPHYQALGWRLLADEEPPVSATKAELVTWATEIDPDNAEAIAAMTKPELRKQYGTSEKE